MFCVGSICVLMLKGYLHQYRTHTRKCGVFWWCTLQVVTLYPKTSDIDSKPVDCKPCKRIETAWSKRSIVKWTRSQQRCAETFTSGLASRSTLAFVLVQFGSIVSCSELFFAVGHTYFCITRNTLSYSAAGLLQGIIVRAGCQGGGQMQNAKMPSRMRSWNQSWEGSIHYQAGSPTHLQLEGSWGTWLIHFLYEV